MKKILLINTTRYFFDEGQSLLDRKDFQVLLASSAVHALEIHRLEHVNLIVADLDMPDMGGDALCARIRRNAEDRTVSVILVCQNSPAELARAARSGANICLPKPFTAKTLLDHVEKLLTISVRRGYRVLLRARVKGAKDDTTFFCTSQNISASGILIETDRNLLPGEQLNCAFYLPGAAQITADGEVVRVETSTDGKQQYGVRFSELPAENKREIEKFIAETMSHPQ